MAELFPSRIAARCLGMKPSPIRALFSQAGQPGMISLAGGWPASELLDAEGLSACAEELDLTQRRELLQYGATNGESALIDALRALMKETLGLELPSHSLLITSGAQQAIDLLARVLVNPGDVVLVEGPSYPAALQCFSCAGAELVQVPSDGEGLVVDALYEAVRSGRVKALYLVPSFGNPSGAMLSETRRRRLAELSERHGFYIIEDDPYAALAFDGRWPKPVAAHASLLSATAPWTIYVSSLSKVLGPGLRIGWALAPADVGHAMLLVKQTTDIHSVRLGQAVAARYLTLGRLTAHVERLRDTYRRRCTTLTDALDAQLVPLGASYERPTGGMFVWVRLPPSIDSEWLLRQAIPLGVIFVPGAAFYARKSERNRLRLSFSSSGDEDLCAGVDRLARALAAALLI